MKATMILLGVVAMAGCGPTRRDGSVGNVGGSGGSGGSGGGRPPGSGSGGASGGGIDDVPDAMTCGMQDLALRREPPDLLIVLDRSLSMNFPPAGGGASKWNQMTSALSATVAMSQMQIQWGLMFFPSDEACGTSPTPDVPVGNGNGLAIQAAISTRSPGGETPTHDAIQRAATYFASLSDGRPKFIVLATDGEPNCLFGIPGPIADDAGAEQAVSDAANMGIQTFLIGISAGSSADAVLNQMAINGGEARPNGPPYYYPANNQADFVGALNAIAGQIGSCTFPLQMPPPDPDRVDVTANGMPVPRDPSHMNGWDFGANDMSITFYGDWCRQLQSGLISDVHVVFGCAPVSLR